MAFKMRQGSGSSLSSPDKTTLGLVKQLSSFGLPEVVKSKEVFNMSLESSMGKAKSQKFLSSKSPVRSLASSPTKQCSRKVTDNSRTYLKQTIPSEPEPPEKKMKVNLKKFFTTQIEMIKLVKDEQIRNQMTEDKLVTIKQKEITETFAGQRLTKCNT